MPEVPPKISGDVVRDDFKHIRTVIHHTRAAREPGLSASERELLLRFLPDRGEPVLEAGCGAGRVILGLWLPGYRRLVGFDFAGELVEQAGNLAEERDAPGIRFLEADATRLDECHQLGDNSFAGVLFPFNGLMQTPGRWRGSEAN